MRPDRHLDNFLHLGPSDAKEIARFEKFIRLVDEAERAGCKRSEAMKAIYPDVFLDEESLS